MAIIERGKFRLSGKSMMLPNHQALLTFGVPDLVITLLICGSFCLLPFRSLTLCQSTFDAPLEKNLDVL